MLVLQSGLLTYHAPPMSRNPATPMKTTVPNMPVVTARGCAAITVHACIYYVHDYTKGL